MVVALVPFLFRRALYYLDSDFPRNIRFVYFRMKLTLTLLAAVAAHVSLAAPAGEAQVPTQTEPSVTIADGSEPSANVLIAPKAEVVIAPHAKVIMTPEHRRERGSYEYLNTQLAATSPEDGRGDREDPLDRSSDRVVRSVKGVVRALREWLDHALDRDTEDVLRDLDDLLRKHAPEDRNDHDGTGRDYDGRRRQHAPEDRNDREGHGRDYDGRRPQQRLGMPADRREDGFASAAAAGGKPWTIQGFTRNCNSADTTCSYRYTINPNDGSPVGVCSYSVTGKPASRASASGNRCGAFTVSQAWSGQFGEKSGFTTFSVVRGRQIIWPAYSDVRLKNTVPVKPDQSYAPQNLP